MSQVFLEWIGPIGFFLTVGFLLDRIIEPQRIEIDKQSLKKTPQFFAALDEASGGIERFFGRRLFALRHLLRVGAISSAIFLIIFFTLDFPNLRADTTVKSGSITAIALFSYCILVNCILDAISLRVTQLMIGLFRDVRTLFSLVVSVLSDFLITINIAIYLGSILIAASVFAVVEMINGGIPDRKFTALYTITKMSTRFGDRYQVSLSTQIDGLSYSPDRGTFLDFVNFDNSKIDIGALGKIGGMAVLTGYRVIRLPSGQIVLNRPASDEPYDFENQLSVDDRIGLFEPIREGEFGVYQIEMSGTLRQLGKDYAGISMGTFKRFDDLETQILDIVGGKTIMFSPIQLYHGRPPGFSPFFPEQICMYESIHTEDQVANFHECPYVVEALSGRENSYLLDFFGSDDRLSYYTIPASTMILTSLWFTGLLYVSILGSALRVYFAHHIFGFGQRVLPYLSRAPFSIGGLLLGSILSLILNTISL